MRRWDECNYIVIDLEGTGGQEKENEDILEVAAVPIIKGVVKPDSYFHSLINPKRPIPKLPWVYIKDEDVKNAPTFDDIKSDLLDFLDGSILIGHNVNVDWRLLKRKFPTYNPIIIDTLKLSRRLYSNHQSHKLNDLIDRFKLGDLVKTTKHMKRHRALYDATVTSYIFIKIIEEKEIGDISLNDLVRLCGIATREYKQDSLF